MHSSSENRFHLINIIFVFNLIFDFVALSSLITLGCTRITKWKILYICNSLVIKNRSVFPCRDSEVIITGNDNMQSNKEDFLSNRCEEHVAAFQSYFDR